MGKRSSTNALHLASFVLFVVWAIGTLVNMVLGFMGVNLPFAGLVENILRICAMLVMVYCAYLYYSSHKSTTVSVLFWISVVVAVVVIVLPFVM